MSRVQKGSRWMMAETPIREPRTVTEKRAFRRWGNYITRLENEMIHEASRLAGGSGDALDVGCDGGRWAKLLSDLGWKMTCTELAPGRVRYRGQAGLDQGAAGLPAGFQVGGGIGYR